MQISNLRALRYFVETVRTASFTQAARALFVTQSTVSKMIRQLEDEIGAQLLIRDGHTARPTDTGRIVYDRGVQILDMLRELSHEMRAAADLEHGELEVGIPPMINVLFTPVVKRFREKYPKVRLTLREGTGRAMENMVASGELEVGSTVLPVDPDAPIQTRHFGRHALWAIGPERAAWGQRATIPLAALKDTPLLLPTDDFALTRRLHQACAAAGFQPRVAAQSAHWDFLASMASADLGVAILPEPLVKQLRPRGLTMVRLARAGVQWEVAHVWARDRYLSHAARAWLEICDEVLDKP